MTRVGDSLRKRNIATKGAGQKQRLFETNIVNVFNPKTKKVEKATLSSVVESPANRNFVRRNIITKGTVVETSAGNARVTNRPGQEGSVNAILI
jgi:small subunit ribosomal protein S8e